MWLCIYIYIYIYGYSACGYMLTVAFYPNDSMVQVPNINIVMKPVDTCVAIVYVHMHPTVISAIIKMAAVYDKP